MLQLVSGAFHPSLENAFLCRILELKKNDPLTPICVVAPSSRLMERLQVIVAKKGLSVLNVAFHTFSSLAQEIVNAEGPLPKPILSDPLFYDTLVKFILREDKPFSGFTDLAVPQGFPLAVRSTLRDLVDAGAPFDIGSKIDEAFKEEIIKSKLNIGQVLDLFRLFRLYVQKLEALPVLPRADLLKKAIEIAPSSGVLGNYAEILYYGFYDLTGLQADFFQAVVKNFPSRFFFPYKTSHPAYRFATRFRDTILQSVTQDEVICKEGGTSPVPLLQVLNVSGLRDEAWITGQEILKLHEKGIPFHEIAVVARNEERLRQMVPLQFETLKIPFHSSLKETLSGYPQVEMALEAIEENSKDVSTDTWTGWSSRTTVLLDSLIPSRSKENQIIWEKMKEGVQHFQAFEVLSKKVSRQDFLETLRDRWARTEIRLKRETPLGVALLHAEAARGLSFKVVFLLGLEERVFPRIIKEDPFLRDDARTALFNMLGYKINPKLGGLEEEQLLFHLIVSSAQEKLFISYQRSDEEGKIVGMSPFLRSFVQEQGVSLNDVTHLIQRPYLEKLKKSIPSFLSAKEAGTWYLSHNHPSEAHDYVQRLGLNGGSLKQGLETLQILESFDKPTPFDGMVSPNLVQPFFKKIRMSPTGLETFGTCPYKYYAKYIMELEPIETPPLADELAADIKGLKVHEFFQNFFGKVGDPWPNSVPWDLFEKTFDEVFTSAVAQEIQMHPLLWAAHCRQLKEKLKVALEKDFEFLTTSGFVPRFFEEALEESLDEPLHQLKWMGKVDRIDVSADEVRVVDYKTGKRQSKQVVTAALRGYKMQPPIYLQLIEKWLARLGKKPQKISFSYLHVEEEDPASHLTTEEWDTHRNNMTQTIQLELDQMQAGHFPIIPGPYCSWCDYAQICRRNDAISAYRTQTGPAEELKKLRKK